MERRTDSSFTVTVATLSPGAVAKPVDILGKNKPEVDFRAANPGQMCGVPLISDSQQNRFMG
jgi:hypothetical protein